MVHGLKIEHLPEASRVLLSPLVRHPLDGGGGRCGRWSQRPAIIGMGFVAAHYGYVFVFLFGGKGFIPGFFTKSYMFLQNM